MRILVVDDHRDSARVSKILLGLLGHEAVVAYDGMSAVEIARVRPPEAVLLDVRMPGIDGYETCRRMRALPALRMVPIIALTGATQSDVNQRAQEAGFDLVLGKPVQMQGLQQTLEALVAARSGGEAEPSDGFRPVANHQHGNG